MEPPLVRWRKANADLPKNGPAFATRSDQPFPPSTTEREEFITSIYSQAAERDLLIDASLDNSLRDTNVRMAQVMESEVIKQTTEINRLTNKLQHAEQEKSNIMKRKGRKMI